MSAPAGWRAMHSHAKEPPAWAFERGDAACMVFETHAGVFWLAVSDGRYLGCGVETTVEAARLVARTRACVFEWDR